jgi:hypothetical protein
MQTERHPEESYVDLSSHLSVSKPPLAVLARPLTVEELARPAANDPHGMPSPVKDAEPTRPSWSVPSPPLSPRAPLAPPKLPQFEVSLRPVRSLPLQSSLAPGASIWPKKMAGPGRSVPFTLAVFASAASLMVGVVLGVLLSDSIVPAPSAVLAQPSSAAGNQFPVPAGKLGEAALEATSAPVALPLETAPPGPSQAAQPLGPRARVPKAIVAETESVEAESAEALMPERLNAAQIQRTVQRYQPLVRHGCWSRQLEGRDPNMASSAKVAITVLIAPSGKVESAAAGADPSGFPGLGACIAGKVQGWTFPKAGLATRAQLPFTFTVQ